MQYILGSMGLGDQHICLGNLLGGGDNLGNLLGGGDDLGGGDELGDLLGVGYELGNLLGVGDDLHGGGDSLPELLSNVVQWIRTGMAIIWHQHICEDIWVDLWAIDIVIIRVEHVSQEEESSGDKHKLDGTSSGHWFMMGPPDRLHSLPPFSSRIKRYVLNSYTSKTRCSFWSRNKT